MRHHIQFVACMAALMLVFPASPAFAQSGTLIVDCQDASGAPQAGARVRIQTLETMKWKEKKSDGKGRADFGKVDDGVYRVVAQKEGFDPALFEFVVAKGGNQNVTLKMQPGDMNKKLYFEDPSLVQKSNGLMQQGVEGLQASKFDVAEKAFASALELTPSNPEAVLNLAISQIQLRKWDEAKKTLQQGAALTTLMAQITIPKAPPNQPNPYKEMNARFSEILNRLAGFRLRDEADRALKDRKFDAAADMYREAAKIDPEDADLQYNLALALANAKKFQEAFPAIEKAIKMKPAEKAFAELKTRIQEFEQSDLLRKAQGLLDEGDKAYNGGDYAGALAKYEQARPLIPANKQGGILAQEGRTYARLNQDDKALAAFKQAIETEPENAEFRKALAQYHLNKKNYEEALTLYADPKTAGTGSPDQVLFALGQKLSKEGNGEVAALAFERTIGANPKHAEAHFQLGMLLYYDKKNDAKAKELLTRYLELGKDPASLENVKSMLVVLERRMGGGEKKVAPAPKPKKKG